MQKAINTLKEKIARLEAEYSKMEKQYEEPESLAAYEFIKTDMANMELDIMQHQEAIKTLLNQ